MSEVIENNTKALIMIAQDIKQEKNKDEI